MKPFNTAAEVRTPDGALLALLEHDGEYYLKLNGRQLMSTFAKASELALAQHVCARLSRQPEAKVLIGGLGLGFTLQRALELVRPDAEVHVAELIPEVVTWNREILRNVNGKLLDDPRVKVIVGDVFHHLRKGDGGHYDAIMLDLDNGPVSMMQPENSRVYDQQGFARIKKSLTPDGRVAYWSASEDPAFVGRVKRAGFEVETFAAPNYEGAKQAVHRIYVAKVRPPRVEGEKGDAESLKTPAGRFGGKKAARARAK